MTRHTPVLLQEVVQGLGLEPGEILLDGTLGSGGHSEALAKSVGGELTVIGLDRDSHALERSRERLEISGAKVYHFQENFRNLDQVLEEVRESAPTILSESSTSQARVGIDAVLLDLGISSDQLDVSGRGFSFLRDEPLLMTLSDDLSADDLTAEKVVNTFSEEALELIIRGFGEERYSARIAKEIVERRDAKPLKTTFELRDAIIAAVPGSYRHGRINPATRTFQAIRIAVNEELTALEEGLEKAYEATKSRGRIAVISFHSLEDRLVKNYFKQLAEDKRVEIITKKPIVPSAEEVTKNPRARSAKLRIVRKL